MSKLIIAISKTIKELNQMKSASAKILDLLDKGVAPKDIAAKLKVKPNYVYQVKWNNKAKKKKKDDSVEQLDWIEYDVYKEKSKIEHPDHYTLGGIETWDFIEAKKLNYNLGNVVKYVTRCDHKGTPIEDLQKARQYLDREIQRRQKDEDVVW